MRAVTLEPRKPGSLKLEEIPEPDRSQGSILVRTRAIGVCGTDRELIDGHYGEAPPGRRRLVLGHESLGRVVEAPPQSGFAIGDSVVGIVRHPDPVPCANCAAGHGSGKPNSRSRRRAARTGERARQGLGAYRAHRAARAPGTQAPARHRRRAGGPAHHDVYIECTGAPAVIRQVLAAQTPNRIVCLTGLSATRSDVTVDVAAFNQSMVLGNGVIFGTVNANRRHYEAAGAALAGAERPWLERLITRKVFLDHWEQAHEKRAGDVKTVMLFED